jgi:hypothetical protein
VWYAAPIVRVYLTSLANALVGVFFVALQVALAESSCVYLNDAGQIVSVRNVQAAPHAFRARVVCKEIQAGHIAPPQELYVGKDARTASFSTDVGPMNVRWSRSVEKCFKSPPSRAVGEAAQALNRALKSGRFTSDVKFSGREWSLAFIDKSLAFSQFPIALSQGGHPGFMIPPNRIYLVTDYIAPDCSSGELADAVLTQVLLHEMGHVIEYLLLGERNENFDRQRAEGFASWFEQYSADFAGAIPRDSVRKQYQALALATSPLAGRSFSGSAGDYARAALPFHAIVDRKGISGLMRVYQSMRDDRLPFYDAVERGVAWNRSALERQAQELLKR